MSGSCCTKCYNPRRTRTKTALLQPISRSKTTTAIQIGETRSAPRHASHPIARSISLMSKARRPG